jgi:hypothetical protein
MTVRIPGKLMDRLRIRLAQDGEKFQSKTLELLERIRQQRARVRAR